MSALAAAAAAQQRSGGVAATRTPGAANVPRRRPLLPPCRARMTVGGDNLRPTSPQGWEAMRQALREAEVSMVAPQELSRLLSRGALLVDVRPSGDYARARIPGAASAPIYRLIDGWTPEQVLRRFGYALFGVFQGTEVNDRFTEELDWALEEARAARRAEEEAGAGAGGAGAGGAGDGPSSSSSSSSPPGGPRVVLYCSQGGSIDPVGAAAVAAAAGPVPGGAGGGAGGKRGWQSRSLIAAFALVSQKGEKGREFGGGRVAVLRGGFSEWVKGGRQVEGEEVDGEAPPASRASSSSSSGQSGQEGA
jgi:rhodanese-related sulfurtransferase